jgi:hypothetical protein
MGLVVQVGLLQLLATPQMVLMGQSVAVVVEAVLLLTVSEILVLEVLVPTGFALL